ncbi:MAG: large conductance mechanosensitive channel protein MscL [Clostridiales bacterium]|nr:large conductance mechanosensitive channel protein MscL [Clostridiales bacterium]
MKKFFAEFKKFITRGNVLDMAVGVIVGGAFTGIVNGLSNYILKPIINFLLSLVLGNNGLESAVTILSPAYSDEAKTVLDLTKSIYIDWGAFISAIINFFLIALVLFTIVKLFNKIREGNQAFTATLNKGRLTKEQKKELKEAGVNKKDKEAVKKYFEDKAAKEEAEKLAAEEKAKQEAEEAKLHTTEGLLEQIKALLEQNIAK